MRSRLARRSPAGWDSLTDETIGLRGHLAAPERCSPASPD